MTTTTPATNQPDSVAENVKKDLAALRTELQQIADDVRGKVESAGVEVKETWRSIEQQRDNFGRQLETAARETKADVRQVGQDLKRRMRALQDQLNAKQS